MNPMNSHMQLALLNRKKGRNLLEKGFTLVELMIVIVIVGILSAVALPNFLSQTDKAKATEAKSVSSSYLKQIYAAYQEGGLSAANSAIILSFLFISTLPNTNSHPLSHPKPPYQSFNNSF